MRVTLCSLDRKLDSVIATLRALTAGISADDSAALAKILKTTQAQAKAANTVPGPSKSK